MKLFSAAAFCVVAAFSVSHASAQRVSKLDGRALGNMCAAAKATVLCDAYLSGTMDSEVWAKKYDTFENDPGAPTAFCVPAAETTAAVRGKFVSWLHAHSDALTQPAGKALYRALHDSYPCPGGEKK